MHKILLINVWWYLNGGDDYSSQSDGRSVLLQHLREHIHARRFVQIQGGGVAKHRTDLTYLASTASHG